MQVKFGIHELDEVVEGEKLGVHTGLVAEKIPFLEKVSMRFVHMCDVSSTYHTIHKLHETPECDSIILHDGVYRCKQVAHALDVAEISIVLIVRQEHVLHLLEMHICADICKGRVRVWMRDVFSFK